MFLVITFGMLSMAMAYAYVTVGGIGFIALFVLFTMMFSTGAYLEIQKLIAHVKEKRRLKRESEELEELISRFQSEMDHFNMVADRQVEEMLNDPR